MTRATKLIDTVMVWHAATVLSGQRASPADRELHRAVCRYIKAPADRERRHNRRKR